jgi:glycosyltransferase involved in cell wall biosynthesis
MLRNRIYYTLKPAIPRPVRLMLRRWFCRRQRPQVSEVWPVLSGSERLPSNWPGWPGGKKFAVVLTHDVEGPHGLQKCDKLRRFEQELGFVSSFNFIPEGKYRVPKSLREDLAQNGFEIGVHDLNHDGHLYSSERGFARKSAEINRYLKEWGASGFRSGFMLKKSEWLHRLNIEYDASTFDTDPFEPQPEGCHTIFPFWVPRPARSGDESEISSRGYVELPYTLPQDSALFLFLGETTLRIWLEKLDWIAEHGGMVLVNVHPDYVRFDGEPASPWTYPVDHYRQLLESLRSRYAGQYWQPLPRDVTRFIRDLQPRPYLRPARRICMVTHSFYESDNRVMRYAEALAARGDHVDVLALRKKPEDPVRECLQGVNVFRIRDRFAKSERSKSSYLWPLLRFLRTAGRKVKERHSMQPYDLLHIHNIPDFMIFAGWYAKRKGARIILDIHDIVPEFFASKFGTGGQGVLFTLLRWMERASAAFSHHVIIANHLWRERYVKRTKTDHRCTVFLNHVDSTLFVPRPRQRTDGKLIILFPGGLYHHQGLDIAIRAFHEIAPEFPNAEFHIYGDGDAKQNIVNLVAELGLAERVLFFAPLPIRKIAEVMADADLGIVPKRADSFGNEAYSTKIMEFMSVGVPVIVSATKIDRYYFDDSVVRFFESGNAAALAVEMRDLLGGPEKRKVMSENALKYAAANCWEKRQGDYLELVDSLCAGHPRS